MKRGGTGGANTNKTGLAFESHMNLTDYLTKQGYIVREHAHGDYVGDTVFEPQDNNIMVPRAVLLSQNELVKYLKAHNVDYNTVWSKRYKPDEAILDLVNGRLTIVEKKFQHTSGSVDEKLQTFPFKKWVYSKLIGSANIREIRFVFLGNGDWFTHDRYNDVYQYFEESEHTIDKVFDTFPDDLLPQVRSN